MSTVLRVCDLQFTFKREEELSAVSDLRQGFKGKRYVSAPACDVQVSFLNRNKYILHVFQAIKVKHFNLIKNNLDALLKFGILSM